MSQSLPTRVSGADLQRFVRQVLEHAGADQASAQAVTRALIHASSLGVDSHGVRLLPHYVKAMGGGRINGTPQLHLDRRAPGVGHLGADNGFGHLAGFQAIEHGIEMAAEMGIAAIAVANSSHFGAAGAYTLAAAEQGYIAMAVCNSDSFVRAHQSTQPFHGTNPISFAAPVPGQRPYLLDMATSAIPWNRVQQYQAIDRELPCDVAADAAGHSTTDPARVAALHPLGGETYGYKGAGLAGITEVMSSALTGMLFSSQLLSMPGPDLSTPRRLGHFFIIMKPQAFVSAEDYADRISGYLNALRSQPAMPGTEVMAAGDREWRVEQERSICGIPLDSASWSTFSELAVQFRISALRALHAT